MNRVLYVVLAVAALVAARAAPADEPIPDAFRSRLEKLAPIQQPVIYIPAVDGRPARWLVFIGPTSAFSAWLVTPGAGEHELARVEDWPAGVRVVGAKMGTMSDAVIGKDNRYEFVIVESIAIPDLNVPAGLRSIVPIPIADPKDVVYAATHPENLPFFGGVKDASEVQARADFARRLWNEDTADHLLADANRLGGVLEAARKSDAALTALIPSDGIAIVETWRDVFARVSGNITSTNLDDTWRAALRAAVLAATPCAAHACGQLVFGAENGHLVIRALLTPGDVMPDTRHPRRLVAANASDTQTGATARALGFVPVRVLGEAALTNGADAGGTIGVIDTGTSLLLITRHGDYALAAEVGGDGKEPPIFADFDGDGTTDVLLRGEGGPIFDVGVAQRGNGRVPGFQLAAAGKKTLAAMAAAALALEDGPVTAADACALLAGATTTAKLDAVLAPHAEIVTFEEPGQPGWGGRAAVTGKARVMELRSNLRKHCGLVCDPHFPICVDAWEPPGIDYYLFSNAKGKLRLWRAALYRGG